MRRVDYGEPRSASVGRPDRASHGALRRRPLSRERRQVARLRASMTRRMPGFHWNGVRLTPRFSSRCNLSVSRYRLQRSAKVSPVRSLLKWIVSPLTVWRPVPDPLPCVFRPGDGHAPVGQVEGQSTPVLVVDLARGHQVTLAHSRAGPPIGVQTRRPYGRHTLIRTAARLEETMPSSARTRPLAPTHHSG